MTAPPLAFETLIDQLDMRRSKKDQGRFLIHWLADTPQKVLAPCLALLLGRTLGAGITIPALKSALFDRIDRDLFEASKEAATDLSESLALLWPGGEQPLNIASLVTALDTKSKHDRSECLMALLDKSNASARDLAIRVATGRFKSPVSAEFLRSALAKVFEHPLSEVEQNLANAAGDLEPFLDWLFGSPYPDTMTKQCGFVSLPIIHDLEASAIDDDDLCISLPSGDYAQLVAGLNGNRFYTLSGDHLKEFDVREDHPTDVTLLIFLPKNQKARPVLIDILMKDSVDVRDLPRNERLKVLQELTSHGSFPDYDMATPHAASRLDTIFEDLSIGRLLLVPASGTLNPSSGSLGEILRPPHDLYLKILYADGTLSRQGAFSGMTTLGAHRPTSPGANTAELIPVGKADIGLLSREDRATLEGYISNNTLERFGPVRKLASTEDTALIARVSCRSIDQAPRRKAGLVLAEATLMELFDNSAAARVSTLDELTMLALL